MGRRRSLGGVILKTYFFTNLYLPFKMNCNNNMMPKNNNKKKHPILILSFCVDENSQNPYPTICLSPSEPQATSASKCDC